MEFPLIRNKLLEFGYKNIAKQLFFLMDPEIVHDRMIKLGNKTGKIKFTKSIMRMTFDYKNPMLEQNIFGIKFRNPIGLAAGFDKDAQLVDILPSIGFGFEEIGSITGQPSKGNPKPRLWRLKKSKSLIVHYGLKNDGCEIIHNRLKKKKFEIPIGVSIAKTNCKGTVDTKNAIEDYVKSYKIFSNIGDYYTINISCPNAFGGQPFTDSKRLKMLLDAIFKERYSKPIFIKLSPDLSKKEIDKLLEVSEKYNVSGYVCSNLTKKRNNKKILEQNIPDKGGISGKVVQDMANNQISYIYKKIKRDRIIIGVGGVFSAEDAYDKIKRGASLIQLITGMIFEGPQVISEINLGLVKLLKKDGLSNISEAIGTAV